MYIYLLQICFCVILSVIMSRKRRFDDRGEGGFIRSPLFVAGSYAKKVKQLPFMSVKENNFPNEKNLENDWYTYNSMHSPKPNTVKMNMEGDYYMRSELVNRCKERKPGMYKKIGKSYEAYYKPKNIVIPNNPICSTGCGHSREGTSTNGETRLEHTLHRSRSRIVSNERTPQGLWHTYMETWKQLS